MMNLSLGLNLGGGQGATGPIVTINGLTGGEAIEGDHGSITMSVSEGTITARKWGSTSGGSEYGTGTNPTDFTGGTTLYATATVGGEDYTRAAPISDGVTLATFDSTAITFDDTTHTMDEAA